MVVPTQKKRIEDDLSSSYSTILKASKYKRIDMGFKTPKGTRDFLPEEMIRRDYVIQTIKKIFEIYGFSAIDTPAFEDWKLLMKKCGEDIKEQIYRFKDKANRELGLRFDPTVPMCRVVANNPQLPKPFKRYYIGPMWRYEEVKAGRLRQFYQADVDIVGSDSTEAETESLSCAIDCLRALGFKDFTVIINNRKILDGFIELIGADRNKDKDIFRAIDKLEKFGEGSVKKELKNCGLKDKQIKQILTLIKIKDVDDAKKLLKGIKIAEEGIKELKEIFEKGKIYKIFEMLKLDFSLARGLDYYTGPIFEIKVKGYEKYGSIAAGGRYDNLIELLGGKPTPATGISLGIERIVEIMEKEKMFDSMERKTKVFVANPSEDVKDDVLKIVQELRKNTIPADFDIKNRKLTKQLEYADTVGIPFTIIVGKKELDSGIVKVRDMKARKEVEVKIDDLVNYLKMIGKHG